MYHPDPLPIFRRMSALLPWSSISRCRDSPRWFSMLAMQIILFGSSARVLPTTNWLRTCRSSSGCGLQRDRSARYWRGCADLPIRFIAPSHIAERAAALAVENIVPPTAVEKSRAKAGVAGEGSLMAIAVTLFRSSLQIQARFTGSERRNWTTCWTGVPSSA